MKSLGRFSNPPTQCEYLKDRLWNIEYEQFAELSIEEYHAKLLEGWRRFGHLLLTPNCDGCRECQSLRIVVSQFRAARNQQRALKNNREEVSLKIGAPSLTHEMMELYLRYHRDQEQRKNWSPLSYTEDPLEYYYRFVMNPFAAEEWQYRIGEKLVGVGYADRLPDGLSAIYFYSDPDERARSLGTFNVMSLIINAARNSMPYVYLGYYVAGSPSMQYKAKFVPNEVLRDGTWQTFKS